ncbi:MAG: VIT1/CCC1 transporter family protein [Candidatus Limnocylindrales bacterium]
MTPAELARSVDNLNLERDAIFLYDRLAQIERKPGRARAFLSIAANERRHAAIWAAQLESAGAALPPARGPRPRIRFIVLIARLFGTKAVSDLVRALEGDEEAAYAGQDAPEVAAVIDDERAHAEIWRKLDAGEDVVPAAAGAPVDDDESDPRSERWNVSGQTGTLRASIFGVSDGLVSNLSLVMGVVGAAANNAFIVLAGVAGLLAGAFSMAAGEWISMQSQREVFERQIELEREELRVMPEEEEKELARLYRRKGIPDADARRLASHLMEDPAMALDTKVREELGLDPDQLGSPWGAAGSSFVAFVIGAFVPLLPFLLTSGTVAFYGSLGLSLAALFIVGSAVSLLTGRSLWRSGVRQVAIGGLAAAVTYAVGTIIGVAAG